MQFKGDLTASCKSQETRMEPEGANEVLKT